MKQPNEDQCKVCERPLRGLAYTTIRPLVASLPIVGRTLYVCEGCCRHITRVSPWSS